jgi:hypothetical protein
LVCFFFASSSLVSVCRNFLWFRPHTSVRPRPAEFSKFCITKNCVKISLLLVCVYLFLGGCFFFFFFFFLWGLLALSSLRFWFLGSCGCWRLFWQRCFIIILLCAFLSRFIHLASDLDRKLSSRSIILH